MNTLLKSTLVLCIVGGINWGLIGLFDFNLVESIFQPGSMLTRLIYILVGISAIVDLYILTKDLDR